MIFTIDIWPTWAPPSRSAFTTCAWLWCRAMSRGVWPFCEPRKRHIWESLVSTMRRSLTHSLTHSVIKNVFSFGRSSQVNRFVLRFMAVENRKEIDLPSLVPHLSTPNLSTVNNALSISEFLWFNMREKRWFLWGALGAQYYTHKSMNAFEQLPVSYLYIAKT